MADTQLESSMPPEAEPQPHGRLAPPTIALMIASGEIFTADKASQRETLPERTCPRDVQKQPCARG